MPNQEKVISMIKIINLVLFAKTIEKWIKDMYRNRNAIG